MTTFDVLFCVTWVFVLFIVTLFIRCYVYGGKIVRREPNKMVLHNGDKTVVVDEGTVNKLAVVDYAFTRLTEIVNLYFEGQKQLMLERQKMLERKDEVKA